MNRSFSLLLAALLVLIFAGYAIAFTVPYDQVVVVTTLGKVSATYKGNDAKDAGLHFKAPWPIQGYRTYPAGLRTVDLVPTELATHDRFNVILGLSVQWRITDPDTFFKSLESLDNADAELMAKAGSAQSLVIGRYDFGQLVNTDAAQVKLADIEKEIAAGLNGEAGRDYGIEVERVAIRRLEFSASTNAKVLDGMKAAREGAANELRNQGSRQAGNIRTQADSAAKIILAFADRRAQEIRAQGDAEAAKVYSTFAKDPEFAVFLRQTEAIEKIYGHNTKFLLDAQRGSLERMLLDGPVVETKKANAQEGAAK